MTLSIDLACPRVEHVPGADVGLDVRVTNSGSSPIQLADPQDPHNAELRYVVLAPAAEQAVESTQRQATERSGSGGDDDDAYPPVTIEPGATRQFGLSLSDVAELSALGEYRVHVRLDVAGQPPARSPECTFRVEGITAQAFHVGLGLTNSYSTGEGALIDRGQLYSFELREGAPEIAEAEVDPPIHRAAAPGAIDVGVPARNTPFFDELVRWLVWVDGGAVKGLTNIETEPASVDLPAPPAGLVRPPLKTKGGPVQVLVLGKDRARVTLVRFEQVPTPDGVKVARGTAVWTTPLPAPAHAAAAALPPAARAGDPHLALATNSADGLAVIHATFGDAGLLASSPVKVTLPAALARSGEGAQILQVLERATPALHVDARGDAWASFLAASGSHAAWVEVRFPAGGGRPEPRVTPLHPGGDGRATGGAVLYVSDPQSAILRREVVVVLDGARLARWDGTRLVPAAARGPLAEPLMLVPGEEATYVLHTDGGAGPRLEPL